MEGLVAGPPTVHYGIIPGPNKNLGQLEPDRRGGVHGETTKLGLSHQTRRGVPGTGETAVKTSAAAALVFVSIAFGRNLSRFCLRAVLPSLVTILLLFSHAANAVIPILGNIPIFGTGGTSCIASPFFPNCQDGFYTALNPATLVPYPPGFEPLVEQLTLTERVIPPPAGISFIPPVGAGAWDFPNGDSGICTDCGAFDWRTVSEITNQLSAASCGTYALAFGNPDCVIRIKATSRPKARSALRLTGSVAFLGRSRPPPRPRSHLPPTPLWDSTAWTSSLPAATPTVRRRA
jgi:hypothetical protein